MLKKLNVPVMFDLKGPDLRVKLKEPLHVKKGNAVKFLRISFLVLIMILFVILKKMIWFFLIMV
jgi:hypothetical protein